MNKEIEHNNPELEGFSEALMNTFIQRRDLYAKQLNDGSYICIKKPITQKHLIAHLQGEITLGSYVLDEHSNARYIVFDADNEHQFLALDSMRQRPNPDGIPSYLEASRRGGHLWIFFDQPIQGKKARKFGQELAKNHDLEDMELFPKQDKLSSGPGSLIRLPFGVHRRTGERYGFLDAMLNPLSADHVDHIRFLRNLESVKVERIDRLLSKEKNKPGQILEFDTKSTEGTSLSERIKASVSAHEFISKFVELSPSGQGKCPFHEDGVNSFAVNLVGNYWNCFAGCGGGSIIDFWMRYRDCDFTTAVKELAKIILK